MIIGSEFSRKYEMFLKQVGALSDGDISRHIPVEKLDELASLDQTEIKNVIDHLDELNFINIETIGGPLLYGHISITEKGLKKYYKL